MYIGRYFVIRTNKGLAFPFPISLSYINKKDKMYKLWSSLLKDKAGRIIMNKKDSYYSIDSPFTANELYSSICRRLGVSSLKDIEMIDTTANVGGWSMFCMLKGVKKLTSYELNKDTALALSKNLALVYPYKKIPYVINNKSCIENIDNKDAVIVFDPPWGGKDYKKEKSVVITLGGYTIKQIISLWKCKLIVMKAPLNLEEKDLPPFTKEICKVEGRPIYAIYFFK
jgi:hypothetical protein